MKQKNFLKIAMLFVFAICFGFTTYAQGTETFDNIDTASPTGYNTRSWTGDDGSTWTSTNSRTNGATFTASGQGVGLNDDKINTYVESGTITGGVGNITLTVKQIFSGNDSGTVTVYIDNVSVGTVPYDDSETGITTTISNINQSGNFVIKVANDVGGSNSGGDNRVAIDNITWTGFSTIGTPGSNTSSGLPIENNSYWNYSQSIITAAELTAAGITAGKQIDNIIYEYNSSSISYSDDWKVYVGNTSKSTFSSTSDWEAVSGLSLVFDGTVSVTVVSGSNNLVNVALSSSFVWDGSSNIIIAVDENSSSYDGSSYDFYARSTGSDNRSIVKSSSWSNPDPSSPPSGTLKAYVPNISLAYSAGPSCTVPTSLTATSITATGASLGWTLGDSETTWNVEYGVTGFTQGAGTMVTGTTTNPHAVSGLTANTTYQFYVQADCSGSTSTWAGPYSFYTGYCTSTPTSNDSSGITNVQLGATDFPTGDVTYADYTATVIDIQTSSTANLKVTFATGYTYDTNVWVDLNDNLVFESSELLFDGTSLSASPTTLDASFVVAADAALGNHRMRIGTADSGQSTPNPCYSGTFGVTIDMTVNIVGPWTWNGSSSSDWATAANWNEGSVPTATDNVTIPAGTTPIIGATTGAVSNDLTIDASASLSITSGGSLIVSGTSTGNVTYNRTVGFEAGDLKGWYLMASPVVAQDYNDGYVTANDIAVSGTNRGIATYTTDGDTWAYHQGAASATFTAGKGYSVKRETNTGTVSFTGTLNTSDSGVDFVLDNAGNRLNLLGNPYTSFISSNTLLGNAALSDTQTMWIYDQTSGTNGAYAVSTLVENFILAPGQGFFVTANTAGGTVNFAEANQSYNADTFQRTVNTEIKIKISVDGFQNYAKVYYLDNATNGFDVGYEGELFGGATDSFSIYTQLLTDNIEKKYQVQSLPNSDYESMVIPVGVKAAINKEITFSTDALNLPSGIKVFLEDRATSTFTRLDEANSEYRVTLTEAANGTGRFYLHTSSSSLSIGDTVNAENISIYKNAATLKIAGIPQGKANVKLFNILGRQVLNTSFKSTGTKDISLANLASGVYIVQLETTLGMLNKKIILN